VKIVSVPAAMSLLVLTSMISDFGMFAHILLLDWNCAAAGVVNEATWDTLVLKSDIPVLVDFWAPWCGPCRMIAPLIDELASLYVGQVRCLKLNTDESPGIATKYGIRSIPTVMIFNRGEKKDTVIGAVGKSTLKTALEKYIGW